MSTPDRLALNDVVDLLSPRWSTVGLAMTATLLVALRRWRTWDTGGARSGWVEFHFYWPWYVWSHTDYVVGPNAGLLLASFLTGSPSGICRLRWSPAFSGPCSP